MSTAYFCFHQHFSHATGDDHPEHALRITAIENALHEAGTWEQLTVCESGPAKRADILRAHSPGYVEQLDLIQPQHGRIYVDEDTPMSPGSLEAAYHSAGAAVEAVDAVLRGQFRNAFVATRPPGHHAEHKRSMGFCFFNNVAVAAMRAAETHHLQRIAILDFDAHQGNGTIDILQNDVRFLLCSTFQHPFYPYSHYEANKYNNLVNGYLQAGAGSRDFRDTILNYWAEPLRRFAPELIIVSAGFDAHREDPMAELCLEDDDYRWIAQWISNFTNARHTPWLAILEGGYDMNALGRCVNEFIGVMLEQA
ncbi:deacetylase [Bacterioplanes sanyensis]|uniref:histone deacetylase family protein n=1 Tax=Bacterioplanes sanyensis TaxID=1249553 RepID=UPI0016795A8A|nr:histone deacetylase family protein [Bacterioplanes sanyensis]GGY41373.1 deacetylase [Bacterioplanes sanyensis]